jgi:hypothetical protein
MSSRFHKHDFDLLPIHAFRQRAFGGMTLEGKGGGGSYNAPPPDPALVAAQVKSLGVQDEVMTQLMQNAADNAPLLKEQMQFGLDATKKAQKQSDEDRSWMLTRRDQLSSQQDKMAQDAEDFNQEERQGEMARDAMADVNAGYANAQGQADRMLASKGVSANSGAALAVNSSMATGKAQAMAGAANGARTAARAEGRALTDRVTNSLAGYPSMAAGATGAAASAGTAGLGVATAGAAGMNAGLTAAGGAAGAMGSNATGMYGAQAGYQTNMLGLGQKAEASGNAMMGALGSAAGMFMMSDEREKRKVRGLKRGEAKAMVDNMPVKEWEYNPDSVANDGGKRHIGPMAQDVQRVAGDEVAPDGHMVDLVSLNGINMAAIQDLSSEVKQLQGQVRLLGSRGGIRKE